MADRRNKANTKIRKNRPIKKFTSKMQASLLLVFCIVMICFVALGVMLIKININNDGAYERKVLAQQTYGSMQQNSELRNKHTATLS